MAKFLMTNACLYDEHGDEPIAINVDHILMVQRLAQDYCGITINNKEMKMICVHEKYEDFVNKLTPFIPFNNTMEDKHISDWLQRYVNIAKGASNC